MNRQESLAFLQSCIDKVNAATEEDIKMYREMFWLEDSRPFEDSGFEFVPPSNVKTFSQTETIKIEKNLIWEKADDCIQYGLSMETNMDILVNGLSEIAA